MPSVDIPTIVRDFVDKLVAAIEQSTAERVQGVIAQTLGFSLKRVGRPPKTAVGSSGVLPRLTHRKAPRQLCPVPGCKNTAAPVFGMVCAEHKDTAKSKIKEYRDARRKAKSEAAKAGKSSAG